MRVLTAILLLLSNLARATESQLRKYSRGLAPYGWMSALRHWIRETRSPHRAASCLLCGHLPTTAISLMPSEPRRRRSVPFMANGATFGRSQRRVTHVAVHGKRGVIESTLWA